ncbi:MAG: SRPBCC family protein [Terriglobales bacterium]
MSGVSESVEVGVPISTAYNQWTQFESFPRFMGGVDEVRQVDDTHTHWVTSVGGVRREFDAEITEQHPDERIAWHSVDGTTHRGVVTFQPAGYQVTQVNVEIEWRPEGLVEKIGDALGADARQVKGDLARFKEFIEQRHQEEAGQGGETGAWRGHVSTGSQL